MVADGLFPRWFPDGKRLYFGSADISSVPVTGGEPRKVVQPADRSAPSNGGTMEFSFAPDGKWFVIAAGKPSDVHLWKMTSTGSDPQQISKGQAGAPVWSPDGSTIFFATSRDSGSTYQLERGGLNIWRISPDGRDERPVTALTGRRGYMGLSTATDGRFVYFTWRDDVADIWMMDVERGRR